MSKSIIDPFWFPMTNKQPPLRRLLKFRNWLDTLYTTSCLKLGKINYQKYLSIKGGSLSTLRWDYKYIDRECKANTDGVHPFDHSPGCPTIEEFRLPWTPEQREYVNYIYKVWTQFNANQNLFDHDTHMKMRREMIISINDDDVKMDRIFTDMALNTPINLKGMTFTYYTI